LDSCSFIDGCSYIDYDMSFAHVMKNLNVRVNRLKRRNEVACPRHEGKERSRLSASGKGSKMKCKTYRHLSLYNRSKWNVAPGAL